MGSIYLSIDDDCALLSLKSDYRGEYFNSAMAKNLFKNLVEVEENTSLKYIIFQIEKSSTSSIGQYDLLEILKLENKEEASSFFKSITDVLNKIYTSSKDTTCLITADCSGFFFELALCCKNRIASTAEISFYSDEVQIGLIPSPYMSKILIESIGLQATVDLILSGRKISLEKALSIGLIHAKNSGLFPLAKKIVKIRYSKKDVSRLWPFETNLLSKKMLYKKAKYFIEEKTRGFFLSSYKALDLIFSSETDNYKSSTISNNIFCELLFTRQSQCLIYAAQLQRRDDDAATKKDWQKEIALCGANYEASEIAALAIDQGLKVRLFAEEPEIISQCYNKINDLLQQKFECKKITEFEKKQSYLALSADIRFFGFSFIRIIIDSSQEDLKSKIILIKKIQSKYQDKPIIAVNSRLISIRELQKEVKYPEKIIGMNFFHPCEKSKVVEIVYNEHNSDHTREFIFNLAHKLKKIPVPVNDSLGSFSTRVLIFYLAEALQLLFSGNSITNIDSALKNFGFNRGPFAIIDEIGIDIFLIMLAHLQKNFSDRLFVPTNITQLLSAQYLGKKNHQGFYLYDTDYVPTKENDQVYKILNITHKTSATLQAEEIIDRCVLIFVNESLSCLRENVVMKSADADLLAVCALGFPSFYGGPLKYIDISSANKIKTKLLNLSQKYGKRFYPDELLTIYAKDNKNFTPLHIRKT